MPLESPLGYNMYLFNLWIANHILIKINIFKTFVSTDPDEKSNSLKL